MKPTKPRRTLKGAFTLIELVMVIAILAIITVVGIQGFGNLKDIQARKMNVNQIMQTRHALSTYDLVCEGVVGKFNDFDSLIDAKKGEGAWVGATGTYVWANAETANGGIGIYDGSWKVLAPVFNAVGQGGSTPSLEEAKEQNKGTRVTGLLNKLGIYYLKESDLSALSEAGISRVLLHNPSTAQSSAHCSVPAGVISSGGGGPGFRPDMSAYYPAYLKVGSPVAIIRPVVQNRGRFSYSSVYGDLGFDISLTNNPTSFADGEKVIANTKTTLICFGIGQGAECVRSQLGIGRVPVNNAFDKTNYRNYIAVFALKGGKCKFTGILDCAGQTYTDAKYNSTWWSSIE